MASVNKVIIIGNVGQDPEMRYFPSGDAVCNLSIATTDKWKDKQSGEQREATEWHRVTFAGRIAEVVGEYVRKGSQLYVEGSLRTRKWTDKDGVEKYTTEIRADEMKMLGGRRDGEQGGGGSQGGGQRGRPPAPAPTTQRPQSRAPAPAPRPASGFDDMDDDIPFVSDSMHFDMEPSKVRRLRRTSF